MSGEREAILGRVRAALAPLPERAAYPDWDPASAVLAAVRDPAVDRRAFFAARLQAVNGTLLAAPSELAAFLSAGGWLRGYCDPSLVALFPALGREPFHLETSFDRARVDDYAFGITRAVGAVAETGTVVLDDRTSASRLAALAPWVHVAVVPPDRLWPDLPAAVAALGADPNVIWCTGPSKTADVEGILIEGVHGPGRQVVVWAA